jgi:hypothetical protein
MFRTLFFVAVLCVALCRQATAEVLTVTETVIGSGVFDGTSFTDALVTLTGTLNSGTFEVDNPPDGFASVKLTGNATVSIGGVSDTLTGRSVDPVNGSLFNGSFELDSTVLSESGTMFIGADIGLSAEVLILSTSDMSANYATTLAGPGTYSGPAGSSVGFDGKTPVGFQFATASGGFYQLNTKSSSSTLTIAAVPEPGSLVLSCLSTIGMALVACRKLRYPRAA